MYSFARVNTLERLYIDAVLVEPDVVTARRRLLYHSSALIQLVHARVLHASDVTNMAAGARQAGHVTRHVHPVTTQRRRLAAA